MITVVSGLPRSGTSLMMQMLSAGGMPILTDNLRRPDADNPRGYFEFEPVKATRRDRSWVAQAEGKAVKVVYALLKDLPPDYIYRVVMMHRDPDETIASQRAMLRRAGREGAAVTDEKLRLLFAREMAETAAWLNSRPEFKVLDVEHGDCLQNSAAVARRVNEFLRARLDEPAMARIIDPALHRQRKQEDG